MSVTPTVSVAAEGAENSVLLLEFLTRPDIVFADHAELTLVANADGIRLEWQPVEGPKLAYYIDVADFVRQQQTYPAPRQKGLSQAIGKKSKTVIDATAGWGADALLMTSQGVDVILIERNPIIALLLRDAMARLARTDWVFKHSVRVPRVIEGDAIQLLQSRSIEADCVYLDPMFPPKRKKSAAVNKYMQLLQRLVGPDDDASKLVQNAIQAGYKRVVVKRPNHAQPLCGKPSEQFSSKLVHYDIYL